MRRSQVCLCLCISEEEKWGAYKGVGEEGSERWAETEDRME